MSVFLPPLSSNAVERLPMHHSTATTSPPFLTIPTELHLQILTHLSWRDATTLRGVHSCFAQSILPASTLSSLHQTHQKATYEAELYHLKTTLGYSNPTWTGFTQGWALSSTSSLSPRLPCYRCLRWLPSPKAKLTEQAFSRGMATGKRDLAMLKAPTRICIECGIRCGFYEKGTRIGRHQICCGCGQLGERFIGERGKADLTQHLDGFKMIKPWRRLYFCEKCIEAGLTPATWVRVVHEKLWRKYEQGMDRGKKYRLEKGERLREERGIYAGNGGQKRDGLDMPKQPKHECPILKEKRMCQCRNNFHDTRRYLTAVYHDLPSV